MCPEWHSTSSKAAPARHRVHPLHVIAHPLLTPHAQAYALFNSIRNRTSGHFDPNAVASRYADAHEKLPNSGQVGSTGKMARPEDRLWNDQERFAGNALKKAEAGQAP